MEKTQDLASFHEVETHIGKKQDINIASCQRESKSPLSKKTEADKVAGILKSHHDSKCNRKLNNRCELNPEKQVRSVNRSKNPFRFFKKIFRKPKKFKEEKVLNYKRVPPEELINQIQEVSQNQQKISEWLMKIASEESRDLQRVQDRLIKKLSKIMSSEITMPLHEVLDLIQTPQVRKDQLSYSGRKQFNQVNSSNFLVDSDPGCIMLTEEVNVRGFLVTIGFKDDVAWESQVNQVVSARLHAALTEARCWVNKILKREGLLIYILSVMMSNKVANHYLQIVEAIVNKRITNVQTLLKKDFYVEVKRRDIHTPRYVFKTHQRFIQMSVECVCRVTDLLPRQLVDGEAIHNEKRERFVHLHAIAEKAAQQVGMELTKEANGLLARLTQLYLPGLKPFLYLLVHYIAQGMMKDKNQLFMSVAYLQNMPKEKFDQFEFEKRSGLIGKVVMIDFDKELYNTEGMIITSTHEKKTMIKPDVKVDIVKSEKGHTSDQMEKLGKNDQKNITHESDKEKKTKRQKTESKSVKESLSPACQEAHSETKSKRKSDKTQTEKCSQGCRASEDQHGAVLGRKTHTIDLSRKNR